MPQNKFSGEMFVDIDWTVFSSLTQQKVLKLQTQGYHKQVQPKPEGIVLMFHDAFAHATENLMGSKEFVAVASREAENDEETTFPGDQLTIFTRPVVTRKIKKDLESVLASVVTVRIGLGHGSGFFISQDGYLLTNAHVVSDATNISVILNNGLEVPGVVLRFVKSRDIALIKVNLRIPKALSIRTKPAEKLEEIYVVGTPIKESLSSTITAGIISGKRKIGDKSFIQADAPVSPGNSGGPLLDRYGNVLGISVAKIVSKGSEGLSLFIPINEAIEALNLKVIVPVS
jgi:S1-C subfamily serine protease